MIGFSFRRIAAMLAVALMLGLTVGAGTADARVGGGFSAGSRGSRTFAAPSTTRTAPNAAAPIQRSITQPNSPGTFGAAPSGGFFNRGGGLFGGGLFGGLAAGFLGAGLFGLLFGHGFFGGLGGFTGVLGLILQLVLVAFVARFLWSMWQRRQPAFAGGPTLRDASTGSGFGMGGGGASPLDITPADYDAFERLLGDIQTAYSAEDLNKLRAYVTPEMLSYFSEQLSESSSRGVVNRISDVKLLQGDLAEAWREGGADYATVAMRFQLVDRMVERASGRLVEGSESPQQVTELWTFQRARGGQWALSAIQQI
jgi:predicted lipid-binding transport protein (Tim44 family)